MKLQGISWVGVFAKDLEKLTSFYSEIVGLKLESYRDDCAIFRVGESDCFEIWDQGTAVDTRKSASEQSMMIGFKVENLQEAVEEMMGKGLLPDGQIEDLNSVEWVHFVDPEGNRFELT